MNSVALFCLFVFVFSVSAKNNWRKTDAKPASDLSFSFQVYLKHEGLDTLDVCIIYSLFPFIYSFLFLSLFIYSFYLFFLFILLFILFTVKHSFTKRHFINYRKMKGSQTGLSLAQPKVKNVNLITFNLGQTLLSNYA